eukprot:6491285-Amphidinium_carterae.3
MVRLCTSDPTGCTLTLRQNCIILLHSAPLLQRTKRIHVRKSDSCLALQLVAELGRPAIRAMPCTLLGVRFRREESGKCATRSSWRAVAKSDGSDRKSDCEE